MPPTPTMGIRGDKIAVPLSFFTRQTNNGVNPGGITRRAPGRTSHPAAADPLSAGEGSSLFVAVSVTLSVLRACYRTLYYHLRDFVSSMARFGPNKFGMLLTPAPQVSRALKETGPCGKMKQLTNLNLKG